MRAKLKPGAEIAKAEGEQASAAWQEWITGEEGSACNLTDKSASRQPFLENRLWRAFMAGHAAGRAPDRTG